MNPTRMALLFVGFAPFLYVSAMCFADLPAEELPTVLVTFLVAIGIGIYYLWVPKPGTTLAIIGYLVLIGVYLVTVAAPTTLGGFGDAMTLGVLTAAPVVALPLFATPDRGPGARLVGLQLAFLQAVVLLAARQSLVSSTNAYTSSAFVTAYLVVIHDQLVGVFTLASGGSLGSVPLAAVSDPWFVSLAGLALLVTVLTVIRPVTGREVELPVAPRSSDELPRPDDELPELSASFREVLRGRSPAEGAPAGTFPGLPTIAVGAAMAGIFLAILYSAPSLSLLLTSLGTVAAVAVVVTILSNPLRTGPESPDVEDFRSSSPHLRGRTPEN